MPFAAIAFIPDSPLLHLNSDPRLVCEHSVEMNAEVSATVRSMTSLKETAVIACPAALSFTIQHRVCAALALIAEPGAWHRGHQLFLESRDCWAVPELGPAVPLCGHYWQRKLLYTTGGCHLGSGVTLGSTAPEFSSLCLPRYAAKRWKKTRFRREVLRTIGPLTINSNNFFILCFVSHSFSVFQTFQSVLVCMVGPLRLLVCCLLVSRLLGWLVDWLAFVGSLARTHTYMRACVRTCVRACVNACARAFVCVCVCGGGGVPTVKLPWHFMWNAWCFHIILFCFVFLSHKLCRTF